jgi:hypothetical protein
VWFIGFNLIQETQLKYLLQTIGGIYELSKRTTHIVCYGTMEEKRLCNYRKKYNDEFYVVSLDWLVECMIEGKAVKEEKYLNINHYIGTTSKNPSSSNSSIISQNVNSITANLSIAAATDKIQVENNV